MELGAEGGYSLAEHWTCKFVGAGLFYGIAILVDGDVVVAKFGARATKEVDDVVED